MQIKFKTVGQKSFFSTEQSNTFQSVSTFNTFQLLVFRINKAFDVVLEKIAGGEEEYSGFLLS